MEVGSLGHFFGGRSDPPSAEEVSDALARADATPSSTPLNHDPVTLRERIVEELKIGFLLDGMEQRRPAVTVVRVRQRAAFSQRKLLFHDSEIGSFEATLLVPSGDEPHAAILGLHGHRDTDEIFAREYLGGDLAMRGFVVLMPRFQILDCSWTENRVAIGLLRRGSTLMGLHVYEALLAFQYLADMPRQKRRC